MSRDADVGRHVWPSLDPLDPVEQAVVSTPVLYAAAPGWRRTLATLLDLLAPLTAWALVTWALVASDGEALEMPPWNLFDQIVDYLHQRPGRTALSVLSLVVVLVSWQVAFAGRTPGKRALGIALLAADARPPTRLRVLAWAVWRVPSLALAGVGVWWSLLDPERRTLHDRLARLWVVRAEPTSEHHPLGDKH